MVDREQLHAIFAILRTAADQQDRGDLGPLLQWIETKALERLRDLPPPERDTGWEYAISCRNAELRPEYRIAIPDPAWQFSQIEGNYGIERLVSWLRPLYNLSKKKPSAGRDDKKYIRWYPAAEVIRYCARIQRTGPHPILVNALIDGIATMTLLEESIGAKLRQGKEPRGPSARTREIIQNMASRMAAKSGMSQTQAAELAFRKDGIGKSPAGNLKAWQRHAKKLGQQA
jgi:hypothetical protein